MSVFGDFQRVWVQRFPESALPAAWEEDVRANLAKHKQKVAILREELEKEEFYVEYLETLLSDVEKHKTSQGSKAAPPSGTDTNDDKTSDSKQVSLLILQAVPPWSIKEQPFMRLFVCVLTYIISLCKCDRDKKY